HEKAGRRLKRTFAMLCRGFWVRGLAFGSPTWHRRDARDRERMLMSMMDAGLFYIDGTWIDRSDAPHIAVTNPATEEVIGHIAAGLAADVELASRAAPRECV